MITLCTQSLLIPPTSAELKLPSISLFAPRMGCFSSSLTDVILEHSLSSFSLLLISRSSTKRAKKNNTDPSRYIPGYIMYKAVLSEVMFEIGGTSNGILPPIMVIRKRYHAIEAVRTALGTNSITTASVTPIHISPKTLDGIKLMNAYGGFRNRAPAANGAANNCKGEARRNIYSYNFGRNGAVSNTTLKTLIQVMKKNK